MKNILTLTKDTRFRQAVEMLDQNGNGFLPVVDTNHVLLGVITDGDLRRGILNNVKSVEEIMNRNPVTMLEGTPHVVVRKELKKIHRRQMPLVDRQRKLIEVVILNDFETEKKENWVVIMAGGLGSRLGDLTKDLPKPMLPVGGRPMLEHIMESFAEYGFRKFILCVNYKAQIIQDHFKDGSSFGYEIKYTFEKKKMGTAGALSLIDFNLNTDFFVVNGDVITSLNYEDFLEFHFKNKSEATMCVKSFSNEIPYACIKSDSQNNLLELLEKPSYKYEINAGVYILNSKMINLIPVDSFYDMPDLFKQCIENKRRVKVFNLDDYWLDIGRPSDYKKGNEDMKGL